MQNVPDVGKKYEVKEVKDGYARNFLIPNNLAKQATKEALLWLETQKEIESKRAEEELKGAQQLASMLDGQEVIITVKVGDQDQLFESITAQKIAEKMKENGLEVKKSQIFLEEPIKDLGEYSVKIKCDHNLEAEIKLIVNREEGEESEEE